MLWLNNKNLKRIVCKKKEKNENFNENKNNCEKSIAERMEQIAQTEIGKKVISKMDEKELAELDTEQIMIKQDEEEDKVIWKTKEEERIVAAQAEREEAVKTRDRLSRMKTDKNAFMEKLLKERQADFDKKLKDYTNLVDVQREIRLEERKESRKEERRMKWLREQEEERQRRRDEELKR